MVGQSSMTFEGKMCVALSAWFHLGSPEQDARLSIDTPTLQSHIL
jgi:hypothetical protein